MTARSKFRINNSRSHSRRAWISTSLSVLLSASLWSAPPAALAEAVLQSDVPPSHWAAPAIQALTDASILSGYEDGTFQPGRSITRAEIATILVKAAGRTPVSEAGSVSYADTAAGQWYTPYVLAVAEELPGRRSGDHLLFEPDVPAARQDVAAAMVRLVQPSLPDAAAAPGFSDAQSIDAGLQPYIAEAVRLGIVSGYEDGSFRPLGGITRAEAAVMIHQALKHRPGAAEPAAPAAPQPGAAKPPEQVLLAQPVVETLSAEMEINPPSRDKQLAGKPVIKNNEILDMVLDAEGYLYYLEFNPKRPEIQLIKFLNPAGSKLNNIVSLDLKISTTGLDNDRMYQTYDNIQTYRDLQHEHLYAYYHGARIFLDRSTGHMDIAGSRVLDDGSGAHSIHHWSGDKTTEVASYKTDSGVRFHPGSFFVRSGSEAYYGDGLSGKIQRVEAENKLTPIGTFPPSSEAGRRTAALLKEERLYLYDSFTHRLTAYPLKGGNETVIKELSITGEQSVIVHEDAFYIASAAGIHKLNPAGELELWLDLTKTTVKPGILVPSSLAHTPADVLVDTAKPIQEISLFDIDRDGQVILYDRKLALLRKITRTQQAAPPSTTQPNAANGGQAGAPSYQGVLSKNITGDALVDKLTFAYIEPKFTIAANAEHSIYLMNEIQGGSRASYIYNTEDGTLVHKHMDTMKMDMIKNQPAFAMSSQYFSPGSIVWDQGQSQLLAHAQDDKAAIFQVEKETQFKALVYNEQAEGLTDRHFSVLTGTGHALYNDITHKTIWKSEFQKNMSADMKHEKIAVDFPFSGKKTAALLADGTLYVLDTGTGDLTAVDPAGSSVRKIGHVTEAIEHVIAHGSSFLYLSGRELKQLTFDGSSSLLVNLDQIPLNTGVFQPADQSYKPSTALSDKIGAVRALGVDKTGNTIILDNQLTIWRINLYETPKSSK